MKCRAAMVSELGDDWRARRHADSRDEKIAFLTKTLLSDIQALNAQIAAKTQEISQLPQVDDRKLTDRFVDETVKARRN